MEPLEVLYEDNHCLALNKAAGELVQGDRTGDVPLVERAKAHLKRKYAKPGRVFLSVLHRLDRPVSGVVLFARTSKAAARLAAAFRSRQVEKRYLAVVEGSPPNECGELTHWLVKDQAANRSRVARAGAAGAKEARLSYRALGPAVGGARPRGRTWLEVVLETGRPHQIRVQLAAIGCPVAGDLRYGVEEGFGGWIALHAAALAFAHPTRGEPLTVRAPLPAAWAAFGPWPFGPRPFGPRPFGPRPAGPAP